MPPATQWPLILPTYGLADLPKRANISAGSTCRSDEASLRPDRSDRLAPAQNVLPVFVRTITLTASSASAASSASISSLVSWALSAFLRSGSSSVTVQNRPLSRCARPERSSDRFLSVHDAPLGRPRNTTSTMASAASLGLESSVGITSGRANSLRDRRSSGRLPPCRPARFPVARPPRRAGCG